MYFKPEMKGLTVFSSDGVFSSILARNYYLKYSFMAIYPRHSKESSINLTI